ncbi:SMI1/KNR4 family protein [Candidatus Poribacteria bacterium]|nr:SMI1/KNR4 family protein [Candidatus Poribacteria bacterium]
MGKLCVEQLIDKIQVTQGLNILGPDPPMHLCCKILPRSAPWDLSVLEKLRVITLPPDLRELWSQVSSLRLFEDVTYGQWGLIIGTPDEAITRHQQKVAERRRDFLPGDLLIGEFLGDSDLLVVRCNPGEPDFGTVLIALPLDGREDWYVAGASLTEFLENFLETSGKKFWE